MIDSKVIISKYVTTHVNQVNLFVFKEITQKNVSAFSLLNRNPPVISR